MNVVFHENIGISVFIVPFKVNASTQFSFSVKRDFIVVFNNVMGVHFYERILCNLSSDYSIADVVSTE